MALSLGLFRKPSLLQLVNGMFFLVLILLWPASMVTSYVLVSNQNKQASDQSLFYCMIVKKALDWNQSMPQVVPANLDALVDCGSLNSAQIYWQLRSLKNDFITGTFDVRLDREHKPQGADLHLFREIEYADNPLRTVMAEVRHGETDTPAILEIGISYERPLVFLYLGFVQLLFLILLYVCVRTALKRYFSLQLKLKDYLLAKSESAFVPLPQQHSLQEFRPVMDALNHRMLRLHSYVDMQRRFVANASHQLKTPIAGLLIQAEYIQTVQDAGEVRSGLASLVRKVAKLNVMIKMLLDLAALDDPEILRQQFAPLDLVPLTLDIIDDLFPMTTQLSKHMEFDTALDQAPVLGHITFLREMLKNLVENAIKYSDSGSTIVLRISADEARPCWIWQVENQGAHITAAEKKRIFERFYSGTQFDVPNRSGLGLAIVKECAALHNVTIAIEDLVDDHGSNTGIRFTLNFPFLQNGVVK